jgi:hypothetical protein
MTRALPVSSRSFAPSELVRFQANKVSAARGKPSPTSSGVPSSISGSKVLSSRTRPSDNRATPHTLSHS